MPGRFLAMAAIRSHPLRAAAFVAAAFVLWGVAAPVGAQTDKTVRPAQETTPAAPPAPAGPPWVINCTTQNTGGVLVCVMSQVLIAKNTNQRVLAAEIFKDAKSGGYMLRLSLPHGLNLPEGVQMWIDEGARSKYVIGTADQNGSYAVLPLSTDLLAALKRGTILNVAVKANSGDEIILQLSLSGFTAAIEKV